MKKVLLLGMLFLASSLCMASTDYTEKPKDLTSCTVEQSPTWEAVLEITQTSVQNDFNLTVEVTYAPELYKAGYEIKDLVLTIYTPISYQYPSEDYEHYSKHKDNSSHHTSKHTQKTVAYNYLC